jgi:hypothetical protein
MKYEIVKYKGYTFKLPLIKPQPTDEYGFTIGDIRFVNIGVNELWFEETENNIENYDWLVFNYEQTKRLK